MKSLFIATPISAFSSNDAYVRFRGWITELIDTVSSSGAFDNVFCVANKVKTQESLNDPIDSLVGDIAELDKATHFLFIYPVETPTSALIELGYALGMHKSIILVHPKNVILPFMATKMDKVYENISKLEFENLDSTSISRILSELREK